MQTYLGLAFCAVMVLVIVALAVWRRRVIAQTYAEFAEKDRSYTLVISGQDDGRTVGAIIVNAGAAVQAMGTDGFQPGKFRVQVTSECTGAPGTATGTRTVTDAYPCDIDGARIPPQDATHIALELAVQPDDEFARPYLFDASTAALRKKAPFSHAILHPAFPAPITTCSDWWEKE